MNVTIAQFVDVTIAYFVDVIIILVVDNMTKIQIHSILLQGDSFSHLRDIASSYQYAQAIVEAAHLQRLSCSAVRTAFHTQNGRL